MNSASEQAPIVNVNRLLDESRFSRIHWLICAICLCIVTFDGYGDSGQIENIEAKTGDDVAALPSGDVEIASAIWGEAEPDRTTTTVRDAIERLAYDFLEETHDGWENSDGAYGDFIFDVAERTITLDYNERHMESEYSQHVF